MSICRVGQGGHQHQHCMLFVGIISDLLECGVFPGGMLQLALMGHGSAGHALELGYCAGYCMQLTRCAGVVVLPYCCTLISRH